jgi:nucleoside-diphosphate-sugar epimerase
MPTVFITGISGFIGCLILLRALEEGHHVRGAVLDRAEELRIRAIPEPAPHLSRLSIVVIPDMTAAHAYDDHVRDAAGIVHVACPVPFPTDDPVGDILRPAVHGVANMLSAAAGSPLVKKVIITSSVAAVYPLPFVDTNACSSDPVTVSGLSRPTPVPDELDLSSLGAADVCAVAKVKALAFIEDFAKQAGLNFGVDIILPG